MKTKLIIDTDTGMDDILAISMVLAQKKVDLAGISTVNGLVNPTVGAQNLSRVFAYLGVKKNVCVGSAQPIWSASRKNRFPEEDIKKSTRLDFLASILKNNLKDNISNEPVEDWIYRTSAQNPRNTVILCIGPLTNIAKTVRRYGDKFSSNIRKLVIMGGALFVPGNVIPARVAEYNMFLDPKAADIVFSCGISIDLISLDATKYVPFERSFINKLASGPVSNRFEDLIQRILVNNKTDFFYFYDPLASAAFLNPEIVTYSEKVGVRIALSGSLQGKTILTGAGTQNVRFVKQVNTKKFYSMVKETL